VLLRRQEQPALASQRLQELTPQHPWLEWPQEYLWWNPASPQGPLAWGQRLLQAPQLRGWPLLARAQREPLEGGLHHPPRPLFELESSPEYRQLKVFFRPSRLTFRAKWERIDAVDALSHLERTDSGNIAHG
jgi:hypothetical protein